MGRPKGSPNKVTTGLKEAILEAAEYRGKLIAGQATEEDLQDLCGTSRYLLESTTGSDKSSFFSLLGKVLPLTIAGDANAPLTVQLVRFGDNPPSSE